MSEKFQQCEQCHNFFPMDDSYCPYCNRPADQSAAQEPAPPSKAKRFDWMLILLPTMGITAILAILVIAGVFEPQAQPTPAPAAPRITPTATLRPPCDEQEIVRSEIAAMMIERLETLE